MSLTIATITDGVLAIHGFREEPKKCYIGICVDRDVFTEHPCLDIQYKVGLRVQRLPQGNYTIIGWSDGLTENDCELFMPTDDGDIDVSGEGFYHVYGSDDAVTEYALISFRSLLRSHGIEGRALILCKID